ncbi:MAG TPA: ATP-binding protein [Acidimicrobiales bacterium]
MVGWIARRTVVRRLAAVTSRLDVPGSIMDVSGRGTLERSLAALERAASAGALRANDAALAADRLASALDRLGDAVLVFDEDGEVVARNARAVAVLDHPVGGALARETVERLAAFAVDGVAGDESLDLFGPPRRTLRVVAAPLVDHRPLGAVVVVEDVSERRRLEAVRRDFVANISHELKTPIGALGLLAETLTVEDDREVVQRLAERMQAEAMRVGRMIDDLLDLSRIEAEEAPRREPVAVHLVLAEAASRLRSAAEQAEVRIDLVEPPAPLTVLGDRRQLVSAVHGLVENAITYSDPGGRVRVSAATVDGAVEIVVADRGIGIPARDLDRIFERFYRVDRARSRATGGTGLGLAIVRHVAGNHGGDVRVRSQEGRGSTFTLRLPMGPPAAAAHLPPAPGSGTERAAG